MTNEGTADRRNRPMRVLNARTVGRAPHPDRRYAGRPSPLGNPFLIGRDGSRDDVIDQYRRWIDEEIRTGRLTDAELLAYEGFDLVCWCAPKRCHCEIIIEKVREARERTKDR